MGKAIIVFLFGITLYITASSWYKQGNTGMPPAKLFGPAAWLFGILALTADFLEGLPVIIAAALTFILWERTTPATKQAVSHSSTMNLGRG